MDWNEDNIEQFIKDNKDKFSVADPSIYHEQNFFIKLTKLIKKVIKSIVPYLFRLSIVVIIIWGISFAGWKLFLDPNKNQMPLRQVSLEYRTVEYNYKIKEERLISKLNRKTRKNLRKELKSLDSTYIELKKELKKNPSNKQITNAMLIYYETRIATIDSIVSRNKK